MTFSIGGICGRTGQIGCAVTTSSMAVGARVGRVLTGRGVVFSQARTDPRLHAAGLDALRADLDAPRALAHMREQAAQPEWRQLGVLSVTGESAAYTGSKCFAHAGARSGSNCLALGNGLSADSVVGAMTDGFETDPDAALATRLLASLKAGERAGGECDPLRSASLLIFAEQSFAWADLRCDASADPIADLERLWLAYRDKADAYQLRALDPDNAPDSEDIEQER